MSEEKKQDKPAATETTVRKTALELTMDSEQYHCSKEILPRLFVQWANDDCNWRDTAARIDEPRNYDDETLAKAAENMLGERGEGPSYVHGTRHKKLRFERVDWDESLIWYTDVAGDHIGYYVTNDIAEVYGKHKATPEEREYALETRYCPKCDGTDIAAVYAMEVNVEDSDYEYHHMVCRDCDFKTEEGCVIENERMEMQREKEEYERKKKEYEERKKKQEKD